MFSQPVEVYIDDMIGKRKYTKDHFTNLGETLEILKKYGIKLNPNKCVLGIGL